MTISHLPPGGTLIGRALLAGSSVPRIVTVRDGALVDITAPGASTVRDIAERADAAAYVACCLTSRPTAMHN